MRNPDADSYYRASAVAQPRRHRLEGSRSVDVAIVGAGYTGLSTALHLAQRGYKPLVLEAREVAFGASGRNGGQASSGQRRPQDEIECRYGMETAKILWQLAEEAKNLVKSLIREHNIECDLSPGIIEAAHSARHANELERYPEYLARNYDYDGMQYVAGEDFRSLLNSPDYSAGIIDRDAAHLHPLNFALGLAVAAEHAGAEIFIETPVTQIEPGEPNRINTAAGVVKARHVVLACNGYIDNLNDQIATRIMPLNNFIIATEPLGTLATDLIPSKAAVADTRNVINYFRLSSDGRLLFGGGETYGFRFPKDIKAFVRPCMLTIFPSLNQAAIDFGWGGTLAITRHRLPLFCQPAPTIFSASGYSGHGITIGTLAGRILAEAIAGHIERFDIMANIAPSPFPGGTRLRLPLLWLAMLWYRLKDRL